MVQDVSTQNLPKNSHKHGIVKEANFNVSYHLVGSPFADVPLDNAHRDSLKKITSTTTNIGGQKKSRHRTQYVNMRVDGFVSISCR